MQLSRRTFLTGFTAAAAVPGLFADPKPQLDPNLTVLLSDIHVNGLDSGDKYQRGKLARVIDAILAMAPLPAHAILFGDIAWLHGRKEDYLASAPEFKRLSDAGIEIAWGMGNHDRRSAFLEVHPDCAQATKIPGRLVTVTEAGPVDFIMLDGLQGADDRGLTDSGAVGGKLCKDQQDWLLSELPKWKKPVFVCSHFPVGELSVGSQRLAIFLHTCPAVAGYLHGHDHRWYKGLPIGSWSSPHVLRTLCLPSTGHWGDIGYVTLRVAGDRAVAALHEYEYYFPKPKEELKQLREEDEQLWKAICDENRLATCTFHLPRP